MSKQKQTRKLTREEKAHEIYESGLVHRINDQYYEVTSQSNPNVSYGVDIENQLCDCEDFIRHYPNPCKHYISVQIYRTEQIRKVLLDIQIKAIQNVGGRSVVIATSNSTTTAATTTTTTSKRPLKIGVVQ